MPRKNQYLIGKYLGCYVRIRDTCFDCKHLKQGLQLHICHKRKELPGNKSINVPYPHKAQICKFYELKNKK